MRQFFVRRQHVLLLLLGAILLCAASLVCAFTGYTSFVRLSPRTTASIATHTTPSSGQSTHVPTFEAGIAYPRWAPDGCSKSDTHWIQGLQNIGTQTHDYWIEMPLLFYQSSLSATAVIRA